MSQQIKVKVSKTGQKQIEAVGFTDGTCRDVTRNFENALGGALEHTRIATASCVDENEIILKVQNS